jgi:hypothetical protein
MIMTRHPSQTPSKVALIAMTLAAMTLGFTPAVRADKYGDLTAEWWRWLFKQPVSTNPWFDVTGERAANGQENGSGPAGKYFFLVGVVNVSGTAERMITVPADKALFFGVLNSEWDTGGIGASLKVPDLRARAAADIATVTDIYAHLSLNGRPLPVEIRRIQSPIFSYWVPPTDNVLQFFGADVTGTVKQAYSDGYWVYLAPLPRGGPYLLTFGGAAFNGYTEAITYHITVE